jgi:ABC-type branched-subunit amino acid transport system substrate-binding protein
VSGVEAMASIEAMSSTDRVKILYVCSRHENDRAVKDRLDTHLTPLRNPKYVHWINYGLDPGQDETTRFRMLEKVEVDIILFSISSDYMASHEASSEIEIAITRHNDGTAYVIPIIFRPTILEHSPIGNLSPLPADGIPITLCPERDQACLDIANSIGEAVRTRKRCTECKTINIFNTPNCRKCGYQLSSSTTSPAQDLEDTTVPSINNNPDIPTRRLSIGKKGSLPSWIRQPKKPVTVSNQKKLFTGIGLFLVAVISIIYLLPAAHLQQTTRVKQISLQPPRINQLSLPNRLGVVKAPDGAYVGINDGTYPPFDIQRQDSQNLRQKAIDALREKNWSEAMALWHQYLKGQNMNDAEVKIYLENQQISLHSCVTLIVGLDPPHSPQTPEAIAAMRSALRGVYLVQKEFNGQHSNIKLRLLLASTGDNPAYVAPVAQQIASIARQDKTVVGILGWQTSARTENILHDLQQAGVNLPMVSQSASSDDLVGMSPYLFTIVPPNREEAQAASLLTKKLQATQVIVFLDPSDAYSQNLGQDFEGNFPTKSSIIEEHFTSDQTNTISFSAELKDVLNKVHDTSHLVIFFACTTNYDAAQFQDALSNRTSFPIIVGNAGYIKPHKASYGRWYILAYAFPQEFSKLTGQQDTFAQEYSQEFDPGLQYQEGFYGYDINSYVIVSYDAASILSRGIQTILDKGFKLEPQNLDNALIQIQGSGAWQGHSGQIAFDADHIPTDKALIILQVETTGQAQMFCVHGTFSKKESNSLPQC